MNKLKNIIVLSFLAPFMVLAQNDSTNVGEQQQTAPKVEAVGNLRAEDNGGYNPLSVRPIHLSDQMYRKTIWRKMDLREPQNLPLFASGNEITRIIMDAVKAGKLTPYANDSLTKPMTIEEYNKKITIQEEGGGLSEEEKALGFTEEDDWSDDWGGEDSGEEKTETTESSSNFYFPNELDQLEIKEDLIFDKHRSRMYNDIIAISMKLPSTKSLKGIEEHIASFSYKDLVKIFQEDPRARWFNPANDAMQHNMSSAFDLRLFSSYILKVSNPKDRYLSDIYGGEQGAIRAAQSTQWDLLEYEHNLWEF